MNNLDSQLNNPPPPTNSGTPAAPSVSTAETLTSIFFEPGSTFEALRARPRFLIAGLIITIVVASFSFLFIQRVGYENIVRAQIEAGAPDADTEQRDRAIEMQSRPVFKALAYGAPVIFIPLMLALGGALYLLGMMAMGGSVNYKQALSVWTYASLPPSVLLMLGNILMLFLRASDEIDPVKDNRGLLQGNPGVLIDGVAHPVLATALSTLDIFSFYGLFLAAIGVRKVGRLSAGAAWGVVLAVWLLGVMLRILLATVSGRPF
ncbi:MAG: YIP1 family protein [Pyrinomonadaceae bacterium]|nr:YIP1 family protein [Pyrinomonadaceae bacterium]